MHRTYAFAIGYSGGLGGSPRTFNVDIIFLYTVGVMFKFFALILSFAALTYAQDACESYASSGELACLTGEGYGCNC